MTKSLDESLSFFKDKISDCIKSQKSILVTTHIDCDGLTSGSIITKALIRAGAKCTVRTSKEFSKNIADSFKSDSRDFHVVTDLAGGFAKELDDNLGDNWIVLDHHQIPDEELENQMSSMLGNMELMEEWKSAQAEWHILQLWHLMKKIQICLLLQ